MDRVTSRLASAVVDVVEFRRVLDRIKPIIRNTTDKCSEHNPKIGPQEGIELKLFSQCTQPPSLPPPSLHPSLSS